MAGDADDGATALADGRHGSHATRVHVHGLLLLLHDGVQGRGLGHDRLATQARAQPGAQARAQPRGLHHGGGRCRGRRVRGLEVVVVRVVGEVRHAGHVAHERRDGGDLVRRGGAQVGLAVGRVVEDQQAARLDLRQAQHQRGRLLLRVLLLLLLMLHKLCGLVVVVVLQLLLLRRRRDALLVRLGQVDLVLRRVLHRVLRRVLRRVVPLRLRDERSRARARRGGHLHRQLFKVMVLVLVSSLRWHRDRDRV